MRGSIQAVVVSATLFVFVTGTLAVKVNATSDDGWLDSFNLGECGLSSTGSNIYFFLEPGYQLTLEGQEDGDRLQLILTVLNETRMVDGVETRVVEERESENGELVEVSMNFMAICSDTNDIFYFGEEVDMYEDGELESHEGAWLAGDDGAKAGLLYPANPTVGMKYYQEIAPGVAEDRAEVLSLDEVLTVPVGAFENVLKTEETTQLETREKEFKYYAPGIGLLQEEDLKLIKYVIPEQNEQPATLELKSQPQSVTVAENEIEVQVNSSSTISNFALDEENKIISLSLSGAGGTEGMTEIQIGAILEGPYTVTVDGEVMENVEVNQSGNVSGIKIAHADDSQVISVAGTNVVPEFPIHAIWIASLTGVLILFARSKGARHLTGPSN